MWAVLGRGGRGHGCWTDSASDEAAGEDEDEDDAEDEDRASTRYLGLGAARDRLSLRCCHASAECGVLRQERATAWCKTAHYAR